MAKIEQYSFGIYGPFVSSKDHERAIAEKDREIAKWRRIRTPTHGNCCTCQKCGLDHDSCRCDIDDVCDELDQLKLAYQQLMKQAIDYAENMIAVMTLVRTRDELEANGLVTAARKFLGSPEVLAFLKERETP